jgi:hypothetical protein
MKSRMHRLLLILFAVATWFSGSRQLYLDLPMSLRCYAKMQIVCESHLLGVHSSEGTNLFSESATLCTFSSPTLSAAFASAFEKPESVEYDDCNRSMSGKCAPDSLCKYLLVHSDRSLLQLPVVLWSWRGGVAVTLLTYSRELLGLNIDWDTRYLDRGFSRISAVTPYRIVSRLGHDCFLPDPFQFIIRHAPFRRWVV